jgi:hypothetical protein
LKESPYLKKFGFRDPLLNQEPDNNLELCITIPSYQEPDLELTLESLIECEEFDQRTEVLVLFNSGEADAETKDTHRSQLHECEQWKNSRDLNNIHFLLCDDLPGKIAGVGLARKILMDEASYRFEVLNKVGTIVCLDGDSTVESNYIRELLNANRTDAPGFAIRYAHPLQGAYSDCHYRAIINYEIHLRYYIECMRFAGFPHAYHTVGSSMAVKSDVYQAQGGMNKRKAGEDFYFLNKIIAVGGFKELNSTCVHPSPRSSERVPFGTGKAVGEELAGKRQIDTYNFNIFKELKQLFSKAGLFYSGSDIRFNDKLKGFLEEVRFWNRVEEIRSNVGNEAAFVKRFYRWFDAFMIMKFSHYFRDHHYASLEPAEACKPLFANLGIELEDYSPVNVLVALREHQEKGWTPG